MRTRKRVRVSVFSVAGASPWIQACSNESGIWYEAPQDVRVGFRRSRRRAKLLIWVRHEMTVSLTCQERQFLELRYFHGLTYRQVSAITGASISSVYRGVQRAIRKLRVRAHDQGGATGILNGGRRSGRKAA